MSPAKRSAESTAELRTQLIEFALTILQRDGADALTMRALAAEARCAVGLPYKIFADRHELVASILDGEFARLRAAFDVVASRAGTATVAEHLLEIAELVLDSPAVALAHETTGDDHLMHTVAAHADHAGIGPAVFIDIYARYLDAERVVGRVRADLDIDAFAFFFAGAVHNLLFSPKGLWPSPSRQELGGYFTSVSAHL